ncbi:hypothetical protein [Hugenholtzia roseola]|uniref:hypothetical protein n=1 Tax=Hugenholtzia roseola TaxID=1002 RepID=UPI00047D2A14|nr:hypothetical protein [Hugenholtzia roseola]
MKIITKIVYFTILIYLLYTLLYNEVIINTYITLHVHKNNEIIKFPLVVLNPIKKNKIKNDITKYFSKNKKTRYEHASLYKKIANNNYDIESIFYKNKTKYILITYYSIYEEKIYAAILSDNDIEYFILER